MMRVRLVVITVVALLVGLLAAPAAGAAKKGVDKTAILRMGADLNTGGGASFDPAAFEGQATSEAAYIYMPFVYDTFIRVDEKGNLSPGLATKWTAASDQKSVVITIRSGVKFQDGTPFTVDAVKQSWDRIKAAVRHETTFERVTAIEVVGTDQIKVSFSTPVAGAFVSQVLTGASWSAVPSPTAYAKYGSGYKFHPVGAGPYAFDSFQTGQKLQLRKWSGYWDAKKSQKLGGLDIIQSAIGAPTVANMQTGQVDLARISVADVPGLQGQPNLEVTTFSASSASLVLLPCTNKAPFNNADARAALSTAINRKSINQAAYNGSGTPAETVFPKGTPFYTADLENRHPFNVKKAKALATKGGIQPGTNVKLMVAGATQGGDRAATVVQDNLSKIGVNTEIIISSSFTADQQRLNPELVMVQLPAGNVQYFMKSGQIPNWCKYSNTAMDSAFDTIAANGADAPANKTPWRSIQQIMQTEASYIILAHAPILWGHTKQVEGLAIIPAGTLIPFDIYMTKR